MKNKQYILLPVVLLALLAAVLYVCIPSVSIMINRTFEMIRSGNNRSLMMIYYQMHDFSFVYSVLTYVMQACGLLFSKKMVIGVNLEYFGWIAGVCSIIIGTILVISLFYIIGRVLPKSAKSNPTSVVVSAIGMLASLGSSFFVMGFLNLVYLICGYLKLCYGKTLALGCMGQMAYILFILN